MPTFGRTETGGASEAIALLTKRFCKFTAPSDIAAADSITVRADRSASGSGYALAAAIYADNAGAPGALVANSGIVLSTNIARNTPTNYTGTYSTKPTLTPGATYWLGCSVAKASLTSYGSGTTNQQATGAETNGGTATFTDPFGTVSAYAAQVMTVYVTYTSTTRNLSGGGSVPAPTGSGAGLAYGMPVVRVTSLTEKTLSQVSGHTQSTLTFQCDYAATAWQVRLNSTSTSDGTLVESGGALAADTPQEVVIDAAAGELNLAEGGHTIQVYCEVGGIYRANRPGYRYGFYRSEQGTTGEIQAAIGNNQGWVVVQAFWDRLQSSNGGSLSTSELSTLRSEINKVYDNGGKVILQLSTQYPPTWVATGAVAFRNQFAEDYAGTASSGNEVYDYVWSATMRGYLDDLIVKFFTTLDGGTPYINVAKIAAVQVGGLRLFELEYPPDNYGGTLDSIEYWGYSSPAQGGGGLASGMAACPLSSSYIPFGTGSNDTDDATWIEWYLDSLTRYMLWWIAEIRTYCATQDLYVLHPSWGMRTDRSLPTNKTDVSFRQQLAVGTDWVRQIAAYRWLDRVYPWSTWLDDSRGTPWNTDSDKPPWESLYLMAAAVGKHHYIMGEPSGASDNTDMDRIFTDTQQGAMQRGYLGCVWVDLDHLQAGTWGTLANFTTRTTETLPP